MEMLVIGGTGTVGSEVVRELLRRKTGVTVLTRSHEKAKSLPPGVRGLVGDLLEPSALRRAFTGADAVFLLTALSASETHEGLMALNGMLEAGVRRVVYLSVHQVDQALHLPHFGSKLPIETVMKGSGFSWTILRPNNFFQNDLMLKDAILNHGVYPQPIGEKGLSRVDVRDIAEAAAIALTEPGHEGKTYNLVGPEILTGKSTAEIWSRVLGARVEYAGDDLDAWEREALKFIPSWMAFDLKLMYAHFQEKGLRAAEDEVEAVARLLGHHPRNFENFARETADHWKSSGVLTAQT